jgi:alkylation response protein AidB-like acyl-CoA dehydrogenase
MNRDPFSSAPPVLTEGVFTAEHNMFRESFQRFIRTEVEPYCLDWESLPNGYPAVDLWRKAGQLGFLGLCVPEEYGGPDADILYAVIIDEELGRSPAGPSVGALFHTDSLTVMIKEFGTEEQKRHYFPGILSGEINQAFGLTEPDTGGSDINAMRTRARRDKDDFVINGQKVYISNGMHANLLHVVARTDDDVAAGRGHLTTFLVPADTPGIERRRLSTLGERASTLAEIFFSDVRVPATAMLGTEGGALSRVVQDILVFDRALIGIRALATCELAFETTVQFVKDRKVFGKRVFDFQNTQFKLAEIKANLIVARGFRDSLLRQLAAGTVDHVTASASKLYMSELENKVIAECLQLHGGYGYMTQSLICRMYAFARAETIYAGTSEIQKGIIARYI